MEHEELAAIKARVLEVQKMFGGGSLMQQLIANDLPKLVARVERLEDELARAGKCSHGFLYENRSCVRCFGDGTEEIRECKHCKAQSWHRGGKCLDHDETAPKPYELMNNELRQLRSRVQALEEECAARTRDADERVRKVQASGATMREALEYIRGRIGSSNLGESLAKIDRALSGSDGDELLKPQNGSGGNR